MINTIRSTLCLAAAYLLSAPAFSQTIQELLERFKPMYHFAKIASTDPFDPNGAIFYKGKYHLMYLYDKPGVGMQWGHSVSTDLFHWTDLPDALDDGQNLSGNAFIDKNDRPVIIYWSLDVRKNSIAVSLDDDLIEWDKPQELTPFSTTVPSEPVNHPIMGEEHWGQIRSWDPHGWLEGDTYYSLSGGSPPTLFKSTGGLDSWVYRGPFIDMKWSTGYDVSTPKFFPLGDRHIFMFIAHDKGSQFVVGKWEDEFFLPEYHRDMNWPGGMFFAPETFLDDQGRRIMWAWVIDSRRDIFGKLGVMSLPRVLTMDDNHMVHINPAEEVEALRASYTRYNDLQVTPSAEVPLDSLQGDTLEIELEIDMGSASKAGIKLLKSADGREETNVEYDAVAKTLNIDVTNSSLDPNVHYGWGDPDLIHNNSIIDGHPEEPVQRAPFELPEGETLKLRIFIDRSILEVFANGIQSVTARVYPTNSELKVSLYTEGGNATVKKVEGYNLTLADHGFTVPAGIDNKPASGALSPPITVTWQGSSVNVAASGNFQLELLDVKGARIESRQGKGSGSFDFPSLQPGIYIVKVGAGDRQFSVKVTLF